MTRHFLVAVATLCLAVPALAQQQSVPGTPAPPASPGQAVDGSTSTPDPATQPAATSRTFTAPVGLLFNTVRPERVGDFEKLLGYVQAAMEKSTDAATRQQARGWRVFKATEPGPNGSVLYVFALDPAVPGADYSLSRILAQAYPDTAQLQEIWKLYTGSVTSGGSLLNLTPVTPAR